MQARDTTRLCTSSAGNCFEHKDGEAVVRKCISPEAARNAFSSAGIDSDWLPEHVCRYGIGPRGPWLLLRFAPGRYQVPLADPLDFPRRDPHTMLAVPMPGCCFSGTGPIITSGPTSCGSTRQQNSSKAPLANVYHDGAICFPETSIHGSPTETRLQTAGDYSGIVTFPTISQNGKSNTHPDNILPSWRNFTQLRAQDYPLDDLEPAHPLNCHHHSSTDAEWKGNHI